MKQPMCDGLEPRRLLAAGEFDPSFGSGGIAAISGVTGIWNAIAADPAGGVVAVGQTSDSGHPKAPADLLAARYRDDGTLDPTFGQKGIARLDFGGYDGGTFVTVRSDGRIVVGGTIHDSPATIRLTAHGALDKTFGKQGMIKNFIAAAMQPDGALIGVSGSLIQRRSPRAGLLDSAFGDAGSTDLLFRFSQQHLNSPVQILIKPDGKILAAAQIARDIDNTSALFVQQFDASGHVDENFDALKGVSTNGGGSDVGRMALTPDGKILLCTSDSANRQTILFEEDLHGNYVTAFHPPSLIEHATRDLAIAPDGRIDLLYDGSVQQLLPDGSADNRFDAGNDYSLEGGDGRAIMVEPKTAKALIAGAYFDDQDHPIPAAFRVTTHDNGESIIKFAHRDVVAIYGTSGGDAIDVKRSSTSFVVSVNGATRTFSRDRVRYFDVFAGDGNDRITVDGKRKGIFVDAGAGNDRVTILHADTAGVLGGAGNDFIDGSGIDALYTGFLGASGGPGNDHIIGSRFGDIIKGNSGNDTLEGGAANDGLYGGGGDDLIISGPDGDIINGDDGNDTLVIDSPHDSPVGGKGNDTYLARDGRAEELSDNAGHNFARIDHTAKVKDILGGDFTLLP